MKSWNQRPREVRNLFNPAFCGLVLARGVEGFTEVANRPMPFSLTLLILPLCLHKRTRDQLNNRTYFSKILEEHPEIRVGLAERTRGLLPYIMEAFGYLTACGVIKVDDSGAIALQDETVRRTIGGSQDTKDCQTVARSLGKKLALINDRATIYTSLGIRP